MTCENDTKFKIQLIVPVVKNFPANAGDIRNRDSTPEWERYPGGGHGNPLKYSCLENPHGQGPGWLTVSQKACHEVAEAASYRIQPPTEAADLGRPP